MVKQTHKADVSLKKQKKYSKTTTILISDDKVGNANVTHKYFIIIGLNI